MCFKQELTQLCKTILLFELQLKNTKQTLFSDPQMIPEYVFRAMFSQCPSHLSKTYDTSKRIQKKNSCSKNQQHSTEQCINIGNLIVFLQKHGANRYTKKQLEIFLNSYSSKCKEQLTIGDIWEVLVPRTQKFIEQIVQLRRKKYLSSMLKCEVIHYKLIDLIIQIICKSIQFEIVLDQMKKNVLQFSEISQGLASQKIFPINPKNFQLYLNQYAKDLDISHSEIILKAIGKNKCQINENMQQKVFQHFFVPYQYQKNQNVKINPKQRADQHGKKSDKKKKTNHLR